MKLAFSFFFFPPPTAAWNVDARINTSEPNSTSFSSFGLTPGVSGMYALPKIFASLLLYQVETNLPGVFHIVCPWKIVVVTVNK